MSHKVLRFYTVRDEMIYTKSNTRTGTLYAGYVPEFEPPLF